MACMAMESGTDCSALDWNVWKYYEYNHTVKKAFEEVFN